MAIYHLSMKIVSRGNGQNVVASAAYRSGEKLLDEMTGEIKFYDRDVLPETQILAPKNAPSWVMDRQRLWNEVEKSEVRVNSRLAREIQIALPIELSNEKQKKLIHSFIQENCVDKGMIADVCIHRDNEENPHAHVLLTTREISSKGFTKKNREWDKKEFLETIREKWAKSTNKELKAVQSSERIDHRSFEERGIELLPSKHIGIEATAMGRKGLDTDKHALNRAITTYNKKIVSLNAKREELRSKQFTEKVLTTDKQNNRNMVVTLRAYLSNQREMRVVFNKISYYKKIENDYHSLGKQLSPLEQNYLLKAQEQLKALQVNKHDFVQHATDYIGKNSMFYQYALEFGKEQGEKIAKARGLSSKENLSFGKRYKDELIIRFANKIQDLQTDDLRTIVKAVEADYHFDKVRWTLRGRTDYKNICMKINAIEIEKKQLLTAMDKTTLATEKEKLTRKFSEMMAGLSSLTYVRTFYEHRAQGELTRRGMYDLVVKYNNPDYQGMVMKLYDTLVSLDGKKVSLMDLENRVINDLKLEKARNLTRSNLDGLSMQKRLNSYNSWEKTLQRQEKKLLHAPSTELNQNKLEQVRTNLEVVSKNKKIIAEATTIQRIRLREFLKERPEIHDVFKTLRLDSYNPLMSSLTEQDKMNANFGLEEMRHKTDKEIIGKMYDNILSYREHQIEVESKQGLRKNEYESYRSIVSNLDHYHRELAKINQNKLDTMLQLFDGKLQDVKKLVEERTTLENKLSLFKTKADKQRISEIDHWLEERKITSRNVVGASKQFSYNQQVLLSKELELRQISSLKIPSLENLKIIKEQQAIREVEKEFKLNPSVEYRQKMSMEQKEIFVKYVELQKKYGTENVDVQSLKEKVAENTAHYDSIIDESKTLSGMLEHHRSQISSFNKWVDERISETKEKMYAADDKELKDLKEDLAECYSSKKAENEKSKLYIKNLEKNIAKGYEKAAEKQDMASIGKVFEKAFDGLTQGYSDAQMDAERRKRLQTLDRGDSLELSR